MRRTPDHTNFGASVNNALAERQVTQSALAMATARTNSYVNQTLTGRKPASAQWCDLVATALDLSEEKRKELHRAAAKDHGFEIE